MPPAWKPTLPAIFANLDAGGLATVLAWLALVYRIGYDTGAADVTRALAEKGIRAS